MSAACLKQRGIEPLVLEAGASLANSWRYHYDRLRLHTVKQQSHLPGVPFAKEKLGRYPTRAEVIAYLEAYAARFAIVPRTAEAVRRVSAANDGFVVESDVRCLPGADRSNRVRVNRVPNPERLPGQERFRGTLIHSRDYRNAGRRWTSACW